MIDRATTKTSGTHHPRAVPSQPLGTPPTPKHHPSELSRQRHFTQQCFLAVLPRPQHASCLSSSTLCVFTGLLFEHQLICHPYAMLHHPVQHLWFPSSTQYVFPRAPLSDKLNHLTPLRCSHGPSTPPISQGGSSGGISAACRGGL
jgi:hypothetical protein